MLLPLLNLIMIFLLAMKTLFYLRNFQVSRELVELIIACMRDTSMFIMFLCIWVIAFTIMQIMLGTHEFFHDRYHNIPESMALFIQTWINSIGDFKVPQYPIWDKCLNNPECDSLALTRLYVGIIWFIWMGNTLMMQIILLNFLIAIVDSSFQQQMTIQT